MALFDKSTIGKYIHPFLMPIFQQLSTEDLVEEEKISGIGQYTLRDLKLGNRKIKEEHLEPLKRLHKIGSAKAKPIFIEMAKGLEFSGIQTKKLIP